MRIAYLSVFPPTVNGIGDYTRDLCREVTRAGGDAECLVLGDRAPDPPAMEFPVDRCCSFTGDWTADALAAVERNRPDVVHLQHGQYMGRDARVPAFLDGLRRRGVRGVVTLHAVYPERGRRIDSLAKWPPPRFHRAIGSPADRIVVHNRTGAFEHLVDCGVAAGKIAVIPHGTPAPRKEDPLVARRALGLPETSPVVLFLGFLSLSKGVDTVIRAFDRVAAEVPGALLVVAGRPEPGFPNPQYAWWLRRLARRGVAGGWIDFRPGYLPEEDLARYLAAADLVVFPYRQRHGSASGIFHRAIGAGRPVVASRCPKFLEWEEDLAGGIPGAMAPCGDAGAWGRSIVALLRDRPLRDRLAEASAALGRRTSWPSVARRHLLLYEELLSEPVRP